MHKQVCSAAFFVAFALIAQAQLTLNVTAVPANTPPGANIYVAGNFNTWDPGDATKILTPLGGGQYTITLISTHRNSRIQVHTWQLAYGRRECHWWPTP
jgi:hypothetical protein